MNVLALDSCFGACSAAIATSDPAGVVVRAAAFQRRDTGHAEALMPMIERVLAEAAEIGPDSVGLGSIERVLVTHGPGSFTGARIGVAAARAFALALNIPVHGVNSLALMAFGAQRALSCSAVVVAMPGGKGDVIIQRFDGDIDLGAMPLLLSPAEAARQVDITGAALVGTSAPAVADAAVALNRIAVDVVADWQPDATHLAALVHGKPLAASPPKPLYLRPPDAKPPANPSLARH